MDVGLPTSKLTHSNGECDTTTPSKDGLQGSCKRILQAMSRVAWILYASRRSALCWNQQVPTWTDSRHNPETGNRLKQQRKDVLAICPDASWNIN